MKVNINKEINSFIGQNKENKANLQYKAVNYLMNNKKKILFTVVYLIVSAIVFNIIIIYKLIKFIL